MKKYFHVSAKYLAWLMALVMICTSMPAAVLAQEDLAADETATAEDGHDHAQDAGPRVLVITKFSLKEDESEETYAALSAPQGTEIDELGLPATLMAEGYLESDGPDIMQEPAELKKMIWKLKTENPDEKYSAETLAGTYTFVPDLKKYAEKQAEDLANGLLDSILYDEYKLAEGVEPIAFDVAILEPETEPIETEPAETEPIETEAFEPETAFLETEAPTTEASDALIADTTEPVAPAGDAIADATEPAAPADDSIVDATEPADDTVTDTTEPTDGAISDATDAADGAIADAEDPTAPTDGDPSILQPIAPENTLIVPDISELQVPAEEDKTTEPSADSDTTTTDEGDIFAGLDDEALGLEEGDTQQYDSNTAGGEQPEPLVSESEEDIGTDDLGVETMDGDVAGGTDTPASDSTPSDDQATADPSPSGSPDTTPGNGDGSGSESTPSGDPSTTPSPSPEPTTPADIAVKLTVTDANNVTATYAISNPNTNPNNDPSDITLKGAETIPLAWENLPCNLDLSKITITAKNSDGTVSLSSTLMNFSTTNTQEVSLTSTSDATVSYKISLTLKKADHVWKDATCTEPKTCTVCGATEGEKLAHDWDEATCEKPRTCKRCGATEGKALGHDWEKATCTKPKTCKRCGKTEGEKLGHNWKDATCTEPKTCKRCGETKGKPLGHDWIDATCTEPKTCDRCGKTKGEPLGHDLRDDWQVVQASTDTTHGTEKRSCHREGCDYSEERVLNIIGTPDANSISGITANANYDVNAVLSFSAAGSGMGNVEPIDGDVRYVPMSWAVQSTPGAFRDNYSGGFSVTQAGTYNLSVTYQKQSYQGSWQSTNETDTKTITFTVGGAANINGTNATDGIHINPQTGDNTPIVVLVVTLVVAAAVLIGTLVYRRKKNAK